MRAPEIRHCKVLQVDQHCRRLCRILALYLEVVEIKHQYFLGELVCERELQVIDSEFEFVAVVVLACMLVDLTELLVEAHQLVELGAGRA